MCIRHQHFYLPTCQPVSTHTCYTEIIVHYLAFQICIPLLFLPLRLNSASILGFSRQKGYQCCPPQFALSSSPFITLSHTLACSFSSICLLFLWTCMRLSPPPPLLPTPHLPSDGTQMSQHALEDHCTSETSAVPLPPKVKCRASVPSDKPTQGRTMSLLIGVKDTRLSPNNTFAHKCFL